VSGARCWAARILRSAPDACLSIGFACGAPELPQAELSMMKCPNCGTQIHAEANPCPSCRSSLTAAAPRGRTVHPKTNSKARTKLLFGGSIILLTLLVLAALIPSRRSTIMQNQSAAIGSLRVLNNEARFYRTKYGNGFPKDLSVLGPLRGASGQTLTLPTS
jgi:predicted RNA-binding Zn-ribbon protein involved in translation (DUF1610 family)